MSQDHENRLLALEEVCRKLDERVQYAEGRAAAADVALAAVSASLVTYPGLFERVQQALAYERGTSLASPMSEISLEASRFAGEYFLKAMASEVDRLHPK